MLFLCSEKNLILNVALRNLISQISAEMLYRHHEVDIFGFISVSTNTGWISIQFGTDINVPQRIKCQIGEKEKENVPHNLAAERQVLDVWR